MLTGTTPFADETREAMIRRRLHEPPPRLRNVVPGLPRRLDATIAHMLARSPGERLTSAAEARAALDPALVFSEWIPQANPIVQKPTPPKRISGARRVSGAKRVSPEAVDPLLQETIPLPKQEHGTARHVMFGVLLVAALAIAGRELWQMRPIPQQIESVGDNDTLPIIQLPAPAGVIPSSESARKTARRDTTRLVTTPAFPIILPDSTSRTPTAPAAAEDPLRLPLEQFRVAMTTGDITAVRQIFPDAPQDLANFFASVEHIRARLQHGSPTITDDHAELDFSVFLTFNQVKPTRSEGVNSTLKYHASLHREAGVWRIEKIKRRD
jgi:hypothetical protein